MSLPHAVAMQTFLPSFLPSFLLCTALQLMKYVLREQSYILPAKAAGITCRAREKRVCVPVESEFQ